LKIVESDQVEGADVLDRPYVPAAGEQAAGLGHQLHAHHQRHAREPRQFGDFGDRARQHMAAQEVVVEAQVTTGDEAVLLAHDDLVEEGQAGAVRRRRSRRSCRTVLP
jgi:hypothetical protein